MTPIGVGLLMWGVVLLGAVLVWKLPTRLVWQLTILVCATGALLAAPVGNILFISPWWAWWLVLAWLGGWRFWWVTPILWATFEPGWVWLRHFHNGAAPLEEPATYFVGLVGGAPTGDLTWLVLVLVGAAAVTALQGRSSGVEPVLLGVIAAAAGLATLNLDHLVGLYLNLELQALALYTLVGYYRLQDENTEAALRYLLAGSFVSGFLLWGFAAAYAGGGSLQVGDLRTPAGGVWVAGALLFKLGAAPFHFWTPVVYTPLDWATLALVVGPAKVNLWYLWGWSLGPLVSDLPGLGWLAFAGILIGTVGGFFQTSPAGLLAYSGVVNAGYLGLMLLEGPSSGVLLYLAWYFLGTAGVILFLSAGPSGWLGRLLGYYLVLNLSGLPVFPGFFAKFELVARITPIGWLATIVVVASSIGVAVYYVGLAGGPLLRSADQPQRVHPVGAAAAGWLVLSGANFVTALLFY